MRHNRNSFFHELTPLAKALEKIADNTPPPPSVAKDFHECAAKRAAKLQRRAAREAARKATKP